MQEPGLHAPSSPSHRHRDAGMAQRCFPAGRVCSPGAAAVPTAQRPAALLVLPQAQEHPETKGSAGWGRGAEPPQCRCPQGPVAPARGEARAWPKCRPWDRIQAGGSAQEPDGAPPCASACLLAPLPQAEAQRSLPGRSRARSAAGPARKSPSL